MHASFHLAKHHPLIHSCNYTSVNLCIIHPPTLPFVPRQPEVPGRKEFIWERRHGWALLCSLLAFLQGQPKVTVSQSISQLDILHPITFHESTHPLMHHPLIYPIMHACIHTNTHSFILAPGPGLESWNKTVMGLRVVSLLWLFNAVMYIGVFFCAVLSCVRPFVMAPLSLGFPRRGY